jgi:hypothetical protein
MRRLGPSRQVQPRRADPPARGRIDQHEQAALRSRVAERQQFRHSLPRQRSGLVLAPLTGADLVARVLDDGATGMGIVVVVAHRLQPQFAYDTRRRSSHRRSAELRHVAEQAELFAGPPVDRVGHAGGQREEGGDDADVPDVFVAELCGGTAAERQPGCGGAHPAASFDAPTVDNRCATTLVVPSFTSRASDVCSRRKS